MKRRIALLFTALSITVLILSACGNSETNTSKEDAQSEQVAGETKEITVSAINWSFEPTEIKVNKGDTIKLTFKNEEGVHGISIPDLGVIINGAGETEFTVNEKGTFEFMCPIQCGQGHDAMTGKLIVE